MVDIFKQLKEIFVRPKADDKTDDETNDETDDEQLGTTNMLDLECEESAEQRKSQRGQGLKIQTPDQMLSKSPITLAQLKAGISSISLKMK